MAKTKKYDSARSTASDALSLFPVRGFKTPVTSSDRISSNGIEMALLKEMAGVVHEGSLHILETPRVAPMAATWYKIPQTEDRQGQYVIVSLLL